MSDSAMNDRILSNTKLIKTVKQFGTNDFDNCYLQDSKYLERWGEQIFSF